VTLSPAFAAAAPPTTPVAAPPPPAPPAPAPSTPTYAEIRSAVEALTPTSPISTVRATEASLKLGVKTNTGGAARRGTRDIVDDMRARVGLGPYDPPLGLPVEPEEAKAPPAAASLVCGDAVEAPPSPSPSPALPPALAWATAVGITVSSGVRREADGMGRLTHIFTIIDPNDPSTPAECHHGAEPQSVPRAPPRSRFLGGTDDDTLYWLAPSGAIVRTSGVDAEAAVPELVRPGTFGLFSSIFPAAVTLMVLGISLALGVAAYSRPDVSGLSLIGYSRQPHDPGAFLSRMRFWGGMWWGNCDLAFPIITTFLFFLAILLFNRREAHTLRSRWQAKARHHGLGFFPLKTPFGTSPCSTRSSPPIHPPRQMEIHFLHKT
jgi:hypothetical protein